MHSLTKPFVFILLAVFLLCHLTVSCQSNSPFTPKIVPPSPNAASLGKFGDIPVSPYTGTTEVTIPLYAIEAKGVSVPVRLSYHTGGIRLAEESGWVGLGWTLNAGGMISRTVNDKDDFAGGYFNSDLNPIVYPEIKGKLMPRTLYYGESNVGVWGYSFVCRYKVYTELNTYNLYNFWLNYFPAMDNEPDSYSFNFLDRSGKFIIGRDRKIILQKQENLKIEYPNDGSSFTITDEQGNKYYFLDREYSQPTIGGARQISSWLLSKIITQQKDSVMFNYTSADSTWTTVQGITHESDRRGVPGHEGITYSNDPGQNYLNKTLVNIDYTNAQVQFAFDGSRADLTGGKKLNSIKIFSKDQSGLQYLKEHQLFYSYFTPGAGVDFLRLRLDSIKEASEGFSHPPYKFDYNMPGSMQGLMGKHYSSVDHWGFFNGKSNAVGGNNTLGFLPPFLGLVSVGAVQTIMDLPGGNRDPDPSFMTAFSLNKVTYPTGGFTQLEYEPNYYDYFKSTSGYQGKDFEYVPSVTKNIQYIINTNGTTSGSLDLSHLFYSIPSGVGGTNLIVSIAFRAANSDSLNKYHNSLDFGRINFTFQNNTIDISNAGLICNGTVCSYSYNVAIPTKTSYSWSAYIDPIVQLPGGLQDIVVNFTWKEAAIYNSTMVMGGGLRIKSITDYPASSKRAKKRIYDYSYQQDTDHDGANEIYSYGREMGYVSYGRYEEIDLSSGYLIGFTRYSSSNSSFTSQSSGNIVGYDQVTEYTVDPETGLDIGKTVYTYNNSSDTSLTYSGYKLPGTLSLCNNLNGLPKSKSVLAKSGSGYRCVSSINYYYRAANRAIYDAMKFQFFAAIPPGSVGPTTCAAGGNDVVCHCPSQIDSTGKYLIACYYPAISSEVILLDSAVEKSYDQNDTTIQLKTVTTNFYDNPVHNQPTRISALDSKNNKHVSLIRYPQDYLPTGASLTGNTIIDSLIVKNMVSATVEKRDSFYYSGSQTGYIKGAQLNKYKLASSSIVLDKQYNLDVLSPVTDFQPFSFTNDVTSQDSRYRQMISFDNYDNANNILQYTGIDQLPIAVIWDYKNLYPVAQVKKATIANVGFCSFEADGKGNWTFSGTATVDATSPTGNKCYNLGQAGGNVTKAGLTPTTVYTISYWRKTTTPLTITGTQAGYPVKGKTINGWTYFEHKVTGQATITVSGTGFIDELRLYPFNAQMSTYTYMPQVGMTSVCDVDNKVTYYFYDALLRLKWIKDQDKNVIKTFKYHYVNQIPNN